MSEHTKHYCGISLVRSFEDVESDTSQTDRIPLLFKALNQLMLKQRNRGQDACGIGSCILPSNRRVDTEYFFKLKKIGNFSIEELFSDLVSNSDSYAEYISKSRVAIGHVLYSTLLSDLDYRFVHPIEKHSLKPEKRLLIALNGNFANNEEQRKFLRSKGLYPTSISDIETLAEAFGHFITKKSKKSESLDQEKYNLAEIMKSVAAQLTGAYVITGILGNGTAFLARDPYGIRTAFYYKNKNYFIAASEKNAIISVLRDILDIFDYEDILEVRPGEIIQIFENGEIHSDIFSDYTESKPCVLENVYFSRPENPGIYQQRKVLGALVAEQVIDAIEDNDNVVITYIPNSAEPACIGLFELLAKKLPTVKQNCRVNFELLITKDTKLRTFIASEKSRNNMISDSYNIIQDSAEKVKNNIVVLVEDSIIKGNTLKNKVITGLLRLKPKKLMIISSCPQIRYPCPYGVEISSLNKLVAFEATINLINKKGLTRELQSIKERIQIEDKKMNADKDYMPGNLVGELYDLVDYKEVTDEITKIIFSDLPGFDQAKCEIVYPEISEFQHSFAHSIDDACITGCYPEVGGKRMIIKALSIYFNNTDEKPY